MKLEEFRIQVGYELKIIGKHVLNYLTVFPSTYLCESTFSHLTAIKNPTRSRIEVKDPLMLAITKTPPRIKIMCNNFKKCIQERVNNKDNQKETDEKTADSNE